MRSEKDTVVIVPGAAAVVDQAAPAAEARRVGPLPRDRLRGADRDRVELADHTRDPADHAAGGRRQVRRRGQAPARGQVVVAAEDVGGAALADLGGRQDHPPARATAS